MKRAYNFNAGPSALPEEVLQKAQEELLNFNETGMSVMELSHRSKEFEHVHNEAQSLLKQLLKIPDTHEVLFLQGGASLQFSMIPMNFLSNEEIGNYVLTGAWSEKALKEAKILERSTAVAASTKETNYNRIPDFSELEMSQEDAYLHITSNNTIFGTQWREFPNVKDDMLIADMSSDILSRPLPIEKFAMIYAGAQKNLGPSGVTVVIIRKDLLEKTPNPQVPTVLRYDTHSKNNSLYNTPPTFSIYMLNKVLQWVKDRGGVTEIAKANELKASLIYEAIDNSNGFYKGHAEKNSRSLMNITFNLSNEELSKKFLAEAKKAGFVGLNGHRSVGGCRASTYNAVPYETCKALQQFMLKFQQENQ